MRNLLVWTGALALAGASSAFAGRMIAVDSGRVLYEIDISTGAKTAFGNVSSNAGTTGGLAWDPVSNTVWVTSTSLDSLFTLDLDTGNATLVGAYGDPTLVMHGLEYDTSTGTLYGGSNGDLFRIDKNTGFATQIGDTGLTSFHNLGYVPTTDTLYATNSGSDSFYIMDRNTGAPTLVGPLVNSTNPNGLAWNFDNGMLYLIDNTTDNLNTMNLATGEAVVVGSTGSGNLLGLVYIPEPATLSLLGLVPLVLHRRK